MSTSQQTPLTTSLDLIYTRKPPQPALPPHLQHPVLYQALDVLQHNAFDEWQWEHVFDDADWRYVWDDDARALWFLWQWERDDLPDLVRLQLLLWQQLGGFAIDQPVQTLLQLPFRVSRPQDHNCSSPASIC